MISLKSKGWVTKLSKKKKTDELPEKEDDPKERSSEARERTKGEFRHGNYLEDRSVDYG